MKRFLCVFAVLFSLIFTGVAEELKFGVISDIQTTDVPGKSNDVWDALDKAFLKMKAENVDAVLVAGDVGPWSDAAVYRRFRGRFDAIFGENPPAFLAVMGNHDSALRRDGRMIWGTDKKQLAQCRALFCRELKLENFNFHKVIKGYDIIGFSMSGAGEACTADDIAYLKRELDSAVSRTPEKPIFVMSHNHAKDTVYGSADGDRKLAKLLKNYPRAVYFSGHTHVPLEDERTIHQKDFTSVGTGNLICSFLPTPALPYTDGSRQAGKNMLIVSCFPDKVVLRRYQLRDESEVLDDNGRPWTLPLPLEKKNFVYEPSRRLAAMKPAAPAFPAGAQLSAQWKEGKKNMVVLSGPAAKHPKFVLLYRVIVSRRQGTVFEPCAELIAYGDFFAGLNFRSDRFTIQIPCKKPTKRRQAYPFVPGGHYRFEVIPEESFGTRGAPLFAELTIPDHSGLTPLPAENRSAGGK